MKKTSPRTTCKHSGSHKPSGPYSVAKQHPKLDLKQRCKHLALGNSIQRQKQHQMQRFKHLALVNTIQYQQQCHKQHCKRLAPVITLQYQKQHQKLYQQQRCRTKSSVAGALLLLIQYNTKSITKCSVSNTLLVFIQYNTRSSTNSSAKSSAASALLLLLPYNTKKQYHKQYQKQYNKQRCKHLGVSNTRRSSMCIICFCSLHKYTGAAPVNVLKIKLNTFWDTLIQ